VNKGKVDISKIIEGDRETYKRVYLKNFNLLYQLCFEYTQDSSIAEEIVQDTFTKLWEIRKSINSDTNLINFLYTIAKNKCLNYLRDQQTVFRAQKSLKYLEMQFNYEALYEVGDNWIQFNELKEMIDSAIEKMPEEIKCENSRIQNLKGIDIFTERAQGLYRYYHSNQRYPRLIDLINNKIYEVSICSDFVLLYYIGFSDH